MIKVVLFCLVWIICSIGGIWIWDKNLITKYSEKHGRDGEFIEYESYCNSSSGLNEMAEAAKTGTIKDKITFAGGVAIGVIIVIGLWPIFTPVMLWAGNKYPDKTMAWLGYIDE